VKTHTSHRPHYKLLGFHLTMTSSLSSRTSRIFGPSDLVSILNTTVLSRFPTIELAMANQVLLKEPTSSRWTKSTLSPT